jgi:hypothetical protein
MLKKLGFATAKILFFSVLQFNLSCSVLQDKIDYSTQVKPIINKHCIACHGGVKKQGGFSLLFEDEALAKSKSGKYAIVPGDASESEMIRRLTLSDHEERMPYLKDPLSKEEISILTQWINEGAKWGKHWAHEPVKKEVVPDIESDFIENDIDNFIVKTAKDHDLKMSKKSDPINLARRLGLDIVGFPTTNASQTNYIKNSTKANYQVLVDSLLSSPAYGEKWATMWLDMARYADTKGYERDGPRNIWRYRDWLIKSFNSDKPYNTFITEQLAGDLMPNPSDNQYIATAFHRNTMTNDEGGTDNEEYRTAAVIDRVSTTWETLMGTTMACVQCHSHPYDPFKHEDYYKFMAFFNNSRDEDTYAEYPLLRHFNDTLSQKINHLDKWLNKTASQKQKNDIIMFLKTLQPSYNSLTTDNHINAALNDTKWLEMRNNSLARLKNVLLTDKTKLIFTFRLSSPNGILQIKKDSPTGEVIGLMSFNGITLGGDWQTKEIPIKVNKGNHDVYLVYKNAGLKNPEANAIMFDWFYFTNDFPGKNSPEFNSQKNAFWSILTAKTETTPIMLENRPDFNRNTNIFVRGSWLSKGALVKPGVPATLNKFEKSYPNNRLGLANWMTSYQNPLVARTLVNRVWEQIFGAGIVETLEDMGTQGANPTHKELLDHLSYKFMHEYNWSIKKLVREIVLSGTYQQDSRFNKDNLAKDPTNRFLARGPRVRLSAEQIRDQALAVSGSMNKELYGPPVMPFQPKGIWSSPYDGEKWKLSDATNQYRRAIYIYWKRTSPYPSMMTFDGVGREVCTSRRIKTNTPLQALVTLNDSVYIDLSKQLAQKAFLKSSKNGLESIKIAYVMVTGKNLSVAKFEILKTLYLESFQKYKKQPELIKQLCLKRKDEKSNLEFAALVLVCNSILNLDEVITKS